MINRVILVGRLTKDPELRYTTQNVPVVSFTIAVSRPFVNQQTGERDADFIPVVLWRKNSENVKRFLTKGSLCGVEGKIQTRTYDDNNGVRKYVTEVLADNVYFLDSKNQGQDAEINFSQPSGKDNKSQEEDNEFNYDDVKFSENDLPF